MTATASSSPSRIVAVLVTALLGGPLALAGRAESDARLIQAARQRDVRAARALIASRVDVNARTPDGATALHWAAHRDDVAMADLLIGAGADVNAANPLGATPVFLAAENGSGPILRQLLAAGANPNASLSSGETALMTAARTGSYDAVEALLSAGANVNAAERLQGQTALIWAVAQQHERVVNLLLERGADVGVRTMVRSRLVNTADPFNNMARRTTPRTMRVDDGGSTALLFAARVGSMEAVKSLLAHGADMNVRSASGATPLIVAAHSGHGRLAALLLEAGADPNVGGAGYTALHAAVLRGDHAAVQAFMAHHADPNARVAQGMRMTRYGADYALPDAFTGATPLFVAARLGEVEIAKTLIAAGADPNLGSRDGTTPLMQASGLRLDIGGLRPEPHPDADESHSLIILEALVVAGADANRANDGGDTALHGAAAKGWTNVIRALARAGGRFDVLNGKGQSPLAIAESARSRGNATADLIRALAGIR